MEILIQILDILAYFLVTTDLFGEHRLSLLHSKLDRLHVQAKAWVECFAEMASIVWARGFSIQVRVLTLFIGGGFVLAIALKLWPSNSIWNHLAEVVVQVFVWIVTLFLLAVHAALFSTFVLLGVWWAIDMALWFLRKLRLSGVLLALGTVCFLASKAIQIYLICSKA